MITQPSTRICGLLLYLFAFPTVCIPADDRPNVVLILADDLGYETLGCYGGTSYSTPNLDRLAAEGMRLDRAYAMPLCTNTRVQLMTGRYNLHNWRAFGILDPEATTFGHLMQAAGYRTCMAGKWQMTSYDPPDYPGASSRRNAGMRAAASGFDEYSLWHTGHTETKGSRYADPVIDQNGNLLSTTRDQYGPDIWTDFIADFMARHRDVPFFVYYSMALPHNPMNPTPDSPEWQDRNQRHADVTRFATDMIHYTDKMVGKVVDRLTELGLREKTLVLFTSDNGTNARVQSNFRGQVVRGEKGQGSELGIRVPMIANWPGTIAPSTSQALIDSVDFLPTLLDVSRSDSAQAAGLDGVSFRPLLAGQVSQIRDHVFVHHDPRPGWDKDRFPLIRLAIGPRYKLYEDGRMLDVVDDMLERSPLEVNADSPEQREARQELQSVLDSHLPYSGFDPRTVPRPDPHLHHADYSFQDQGGLVVVEAEMLPYPRDEAFRSESLLSDFTGTGYLRALRFQNRTPSAGITNVAVRLDTKGPWHLAIRCRSDHVEVVPEASIWLRCAAAGWQKVSLAEGTQPGEWTWIATADMERLPLEEGRNILHLAPCSHNLKIDRLVLFQADRRQDAFALDSRVSDFHPWAGD